MSHQAGPRDTELRDKIAGAQISAAIREARNEQTSS